MYPYYHTPAAGYSAPSSTGYPPPPLTQPYNSGLTFTRWGLGAYPSGSVPHSGIAYGPRDAAVHPYPPKPLTFVLIHGAWANADFWNETASELRRMGHKVYAPEYAGHGQNSSNSVTHAMVTETVADFITSHQLRDIILVGHSFGGTIIQKTAELVPERIKRLVFMNAFVLLDGESGADAIPAPARALFEQLRDSSGNNTIPLPFPFYRDTFANLASLELAIQLHSSSPAEPAGPLFEKLDLKKFYSLSIPKSYFYLDEDTVLPQTDEAGWHPHMSGRLGAFRFVRGSGDHMSTARTEPGMIAQKLYIAGRD
jgi:pimeloyl-ACP methyl ester carboxylesterase